MSKQFPSLKAMAENKTDGVNKQGSQFTVDVRLIEFEDGFNGRPIDPDHVASFKETKRNGGTWPAITVRVEDGRIIAVDGHHRVTAQLELLTEDKDGAILPGMDAVQFRGNDADRVLLMITSQQGKPMTPLQLGVQYRKMVAFGWTAPQIAARVGKSGQHVNDMMKLAEANSDVHAMVERGEVAAHVALKTVKKHGSGAGKVLAGQLEDAKKTGKKKVTEKVLRKSALKDVTNNRAIIKDQLKALLDSAVLDFQTKKSLRKTLDIIDNGASLESDPDEKGIGPKELANAGKTLVATVANRSAATTEHLKAMLQSPSFDANTKTAIKQVMTAAKLKIEPASTLDLVSAIEAEIESKGEVMAETLCSDYAHLIVYLRATGTK